MELTSSASNSFCEITKQPCSTTALQTLTHTGTTVKTSTAASILFLTFFADMAPCRPLHEIIHAQYSNMIHIGKTGLTAFRQYDEDM